MESIDLITASILSKKLAAGLDALVLDVKTGSGAFMATLRRRPRARAQRWSRWRTAPAARRAALITDMNEPLATAAGNALEMANAARFLRGDAIDGRLCDVTVALGGELLAAAGLAPTPPRAPTRMRDGLRLRRGGRALRPHGARRSAGRRASSTTSSAHLRRRAGDRAT